LEAAIAAAESSAPPGKRPIVEDRTQLPLHFETVMRDEVILAGAE